jgi:hypothetical protein
LRANRYHWTIRALIEQAFGGALHRDGNSFFHPGDKHVSGPDSGGNGPEPFGNKLFQDQPDDGDTRQSEPNAPDIFPFCESGKVGATESINVVDPGLDRFFYFGPSGISLQPAVMMDGEANSRTTPGNPLQLGNRNIVMGRRQMLEHIRTLNGIKTGIGEGEAGEVCCDRKNITFPDFTLQNFKGFKREVNGEHGLESFGERDAGPPCPATGIEHRSFRVFARSKLGYKIGACVINHVIATLKIVFPRNIVPGLPFGTSVLEGPLQTGIVQ